MRGDVDCNGEIGLADVAALAKWVAAADLYPLTDAGLANGEITDDGSVNAADLNKLIEYTVKAIKVL